jgi:preprotein translocase subunit SecF
MDWLKYKRVYFLVSLTLISFSLFSLLKWGLKFSVEFRGGAIIEYQLESEISTEEASKKISEQDMEVGSIQKVGDKKYLFRLTPITAEEKERVKAQLEDMVGEGVVEELRFETVGPSVGPELVKKTIYAIAIAASAILVWVAYQFKSFKFGVSSILAMFHDSFILIGTFSLFGHFWGAEVDFLFITSLLTTLSFSVHDTIVVFDRIREISKKYGGELTNIANRALTETMVRSLNNSFTIVFMLVALILLGGSSVRWFAVALFIGTILGTYSSPFVAVPFLVVWDWMVEKIELPRKLSVFQKIKR